MFIGHKLVFSGHSASRGQCKETCKKVKMATFDDFSVLNYLSMLPRRALTHLIDPTPHEGTDTILHVTHIKENCWQLLGHFIH